MRGLVPVVSIAAMMLAANVAHANRGTTGYSGKPYNGVAETCTRMGCHTGGTQPDLTLNVPTTMRAGTSAEFSITVRGTGNESTSFNAAMPDGIVVAAGQNTVVDFPQRAEIAAVAPQPGGTSATYRFRVTAPPTNGTFAVWVAGMASNSDDTNGGDGVRTATRTITVTGGTEPGPDAGPKDGGAPPRDGGNASDAGSSDGGQGGPGPGENPGEPDEDETLSGGKSGCSMGAATGGSALSSALLAIALLVRRRRRE